VPFTASPRETFITLHQRQWRRALFRIWPFVGPTCNAPDDERDYEVGYGKPRHSRGRIQWVDRSERPVLLAIVILGERVRGPQLLGLAAIVVGISLMYRVHVNLSARSLWAMALPVAVSAIRGVIQPNGLAFALLHLANTRVLAETVPPRLSATALTLYSTVGVGAAVALLTARLGLSTRNSRPAAPAYEGAGTVQRDFFCSAWAKQASQLPGKQMRAGQCEVRSAWGRFGTCLVQRLSRAPRVYWPAPSWLFSTKSGRRTAATPGCSSACDRRPLTCPAVFCSSVAGANKDPEYPELSA